jgi:hypothetical protein
VKQIFKMMAEGRGGVNRSSRSERG